MAIHQPDQAIFRSVPCDPDIRPGGTFPDYALPDHTNTVRKLSELQGDDPLVLTLARGNYCPKEHQQHLELAANYRRSPSPTPRSSRSRPTTTTRHRSSAPQSAPSGPSSPIPARTIQKDLDIQEYTDPEHDPMIPHTLVLKPGLVIHSVSTTATGSGDARRSTTYGATCALRRARSAPTGT
jgi:hypothetical protein